MSVTLETHFVESKSTDPVERAIARKVIRILNDQTLDRQQRESLVKKAQRELLRHQQQVRQRQLLEQGSGESPTAQRLSSHLNAGAGRTNASRCKPQEVRICMDPGRAGAARRDVQACLCPADTR
ncbi:hypothetical protein [Extensimonas sp. H3M7-6]|uniref:hypothetical protein n=1 Tax=Extensimonas soli TaxID=3031322 RepID=UPI0023DC9824|nr:hypothetical protein [Extensimonas sp. H3M7-6]MDF1480614.1 hypothetical protein [Extensimonas sp. H3M7-6]